MKTALIVGLILALAASIATGLAGLWPNLRDRSSVNDRRERVRIAAAVDRDIVEGNAHVSRVLLDCIRGKALVQVTPDGHTSNVGECAVVAENFGDHIDPVDYDQAACDF
jgi:hypothetical protein